MTYSSDEKNFIADFRMLLSKYHVKLRIEQDHKLPERGFISNFDVLCILDPKHPERFKINLNKLSLKWKTIDDDPH